MLVITAITAVQAQRMLPRQKGLEIGAGLLSSDEPGRNYFLDLLLTVNGRNGGYWIWGAEYTHQYADYKTLQIPLETYLGEVGYSLRLLGNTRKSINVNAAVTGVGGYEAINRGKAKLNDGAVVQNKEGFVYGAGGRLSFETYLSDRFVLVLQGKAKVLWGTDLGQFRSAAGLGLRFNF